jgi:uncharacterized membrane protein
VITGKRNALFTLANVVRPDALSFRPVPAAPAPAGSCSNPERGRKTAVGTNLANRVPRPPSRTMASTRRAFLAGFAACVVLGIFFRVFHVDWKLYSHDETFTSLRAAGHTYAEFEALVHDGRRHRIGDLEALQAPGASTDLGAVWHSLALEDPQHPPLYFWATALFARVSGDSVLHRRLPAVFFALLALPAAWWLAYELFEETLAAWCFGALVAVAPFHVAYAQQAREYSLLTLTILASNALLLRGLRTGVLWTWLAYALSVAAGLWSDPLLLEVALAQAAYLALPFSAAPPRRRIYAAAALATGVAAFAPWLVVMAAGSRTAAADTGWTAGRLSAPLYAGKWLFNAGTVFFDLDYLTLALVPVALALLAAGLWSSWAFARTAPARQWVFVALLGGISALALLGPDLVLHQSRAGQSRYLTPLWLAFELAVAGGLTPGLLSAGRRRAAARIATVSILAAGIVSCAVSAYARTWWIASNEKTLPAIAAALRNEPAATIVYVFDDDTLLELLPLARPDLDFAMHPAIDESALRAAARPFVIAKPFAVESSPVAAQLKSITLPPSFPPTQDRFIAWIHRRAAAERAMGAAYEDDALFGQGHS